MDAALRPHLARAAAVLGNVTALCILDYPWLRVAVQDGGVTCNSLDCGAYYERRKVTHELASAAALEQAGLALLEPA